MAVGVADEALEQLFLGVLVLDAFQRLVQRAAGLEGGVCAGLFVVLGLCDLGWLFGGLLCGGLRLGWLLFGGFLLLALVQRLLVLLVLAHALGVLFVAVPIVKRGRAVDAGVVRFRAPGVVLFGVFLWHSGVAHLAVECDH